MAKKSPIVVEPIALTTYTVTDSLRHDGDDYAAGESVDLDAATAEILLAAGVVSLEPAVQE
jgi:hypothetical protein